MKNVLKTLVVADGPFVPENRNGITKTMYNIFKNNPALEVTYLYLSYSDEDPVPGSGFENVNLRRVKVATPSKMSLTRKIKSLFSMNPLIRAPKSSLKALSLPLSLELDKHEVFMISSLALAPLLDNLSQAQRKRACILAIDSYAHFFSFRVRNEENFLKKLLWKLEMNKGVAFERNYYEKCSLSLYVSKEDARYASELSVPESKSKKIGMTYGIDLHQIKENMSKFADVEKEPDSLIFTGNLSYGPNIEAVNFILHKILPEVWKSKPYVKCFFLGGGASLELANNPDNRVIVTGFVESLIPYMKKTSLFISPLFFGAGTKTKVLEAMGHGKVVVGTKESFTEIVCESDVDCVIVDPPRDVVGWGRAITSLLDDPDRVEKIERAALKTIRENHDWKVNKLEYNKELIKIRNEIS